MAEILFEDKINSNFSKKIRSVSSKLGIDENWLMFVLFNESALNTQAENPSSHCIGLLQWCDDEGTPGFKEIGGKQVDLAWLKNQSAENQLDYVYEYFKPYRSKLDSYQALSLATLTPAYLNEIDNDNFVFPNWVVNGNPRLFKYGKTMGDYKKGLQDRVYEIVPTRFYDSFFEDISSAETKKRNLIRIYQRETYLGLAIILILIIMLVIYRRFIK